MFVGAFFSKTNQRERHIQSFVSDKFNNLTSIVFFRFTHALSDLSMDQSQIHCFYYSKRMASNREITTAEKPSNWFSSHEAVDMLLKFSFHGCIHDSLT